jgi:hypothetical protein
MAAIPEVTVAIDQALAGLAHGGQLAAKSERVSR